ncbi:MAG: proton-translocating NADH-quinone oxidoreductase, chain [Mycobacterium sp.]|nr:proton-translocating NADH-quinone oxidoreductase, chain [Mycobacterium sp.]
MTGPVTLAVALAGIPALAALVGLLLPQSSRRAAAVVAVGSSGLLVIVAVALTVVIPDGITEWAVTLARFGKLNATAGVRLDALAAAVSIAVAMVAFLVQLYSVGYILNGPHPDERYAPYAAQISLFTAAMMTVVVSGDLVTLLIGWEVMGLCSYLLIGHDRSLPEAPGAAVKAFLVTRVGDVGFALGVAVLGVAAGTFRIGGVLDAAASGRIGTGALTFACLLLLAGVAGKSAQFPFHTWLPDAMAGPTPVSALIHAATMVAAGVYVVARLFPAFALAPDALAVLGVSASITMLLGACAALAQDDIKRVLAWSTVSQIGYMAGGLAVGGVDAGLFHLLTHAAFKALLFLAAGAVIVAVGSNLMSSMGGLRHAMPITFWTMTAGLGALAGVPPFAGFFSKESVIGAAHRAALGESAVAAPWVGWTVLVTGIVTAGLTGAYATRLWLRTFFGPQRVETAAAGDPPWSMRAPLVVLAVPAVLLGVIALFRPLVATGLDAFGWVEYAPLSGAARPPAEVHLDALTTTVVLVITLAGVLGAWSLWRRDPLRDPAAVLGPVRPVFENAFYLDAVQDALVVRPSLALARAVSSVDVRAIDGLVEATARGALRAGRTVLEIQSRGLARQLTFVLTGALILGVAAVALSGVLT